MIDRIKVCIFSLAFCVGLFAEDPLRAELFLAVDFDIAASGIQDKAIVDANGNTTAWLVLFLTDDTDLYAYQFSVRFNADRLKLISKDDTPPTNFNEELTNDPWRIGQNDGNFENYIEYNYFDGKIDGDGSITPADIPNGLVLGKLNFEVKGSGDALLIMPGLYDEGDTGVPGDVRFFDVFRGDAGPIDVSPASFLGGRIVAVPEPSSLLLVTAVAGVCCIGYLRAITGGTKKQVSS